MLKNILVRVSITTILALMMVSTLTTMVSALDVPCAVYGHIYYNGAPANGASLTASGSHGQITVQGNYYKVDSVPSNGSISVTASYNSHSATITVHTPASGSAVNDQDIYITYTPSQNTGNNGGVSQPAVTPTPTPTPTPMPTASPTVTATPTASPTATPTPTPTPTLEQGGFPWWLLLLILIIIVIIAAAYWFFFRRG